MPDSPHILMCPPDYYGIEYEINPWMDRRRQCDHEAAARQWNDLRALIEEAGARVSCLAPVPALPDLVFTANAALIYGDTAVPARFRHPQRQGEEPVGRRWLAEHGFRLAPLVSGAYFEGAGDALFCGDTLFAGYRIRSDVRGPTEIGERFGCRVIPLELTDTRFYHLDTCFCPLAPGTAMYYPGAFDDYGRRALRELIGDLIAVGEAEARQFACNAVVVGRRVIANAGCGALRPELAARGFTLLETPLDEFLKAGGAAKCLTLRLDGEEAAAWKSAPGMGPPTIGAVPSVADAPGRRSGL